MQKNWQILDKISDRFIDQHPAYDRLTLQLLHNRNILKKNQIEEFLNPDYEKFSHDPYLFKDMNDAVEMIISTIKKKEKILVYGDYDADGVTAATVLVEMFRTLNADTEVYIPDRVSEGYGLNEKAIGDFAIKNFKLIITVDNGIRNKNEVAAIKAVGLSVIVTDHHIAPDEKDLPDCLIIDPIAPGEKYPYKHLAGVGVALKLAVAIIARSTLTSEQKKRLEEKLLDLAAIGTVADCVPLDGENRLIVKQGLNVLNKTKRLGLLALIDEAKIAGRKLDAWNIGFQLGPRLNAAGRMDHANMAYELLNCRDKNEAQVLARDLCGKNIDRQKETEGIVRQIESSLDSSGSHKILIAISPSISGGEPVWNEGVIGLVAGRLAEKYYLPVLVMTGTSQEIKGSGRSIPEFNLAEGIERCKDGLAKFGGHAMACGFSITGRANLDLFIDEIRAVAVESLGQMTLAPRILVEAELELASLDEELLGRVERFAPFGEGNERPVFICRGVSVLDMIFMGVNGQHLKLRLKKGNSSVLSALAFGRAENWRDLRIGDKIDLVFYAEMNEFNGKREVQLRIVDLKQAIN